MSRMDFLKLYTFDVVNAFAVLVVIGQAISIALLALLIWEAIAKRKTAVTTWVSAHGLILTFIVALVATGGSLFLSEIAGWTPCKLCWFQRIFMYPQALLLLIALLKRDRQIAPYILALSIIGILIAGFHYNEQLQAALHPVLDAQGNNTLLKPCDASGTSCAATQINFIFGYITIPLMAGTGFLLNILGSIAMLRRKTA
ncbi:MAG TPA: disulfide bond formation protein B [Candidatus Peribacteraceae bacterium]|nr:disulfide bond formation protein B [Candidatus Peribacteraceae bacterium]